MSKYKLTCRKNVAVKYDGKWYHPGDVWYSDSPVTNPHINCDLIGISRMIEKISVEKIDKKMIDKKITKESE